MYGQDEIGKATIHAGSFKQGNTGFDIADQPATKKSVDLDPGCIAERIRVNCLNGEEFAQEIGKLVEASLTILHNERKQVQFTIQDQQTKEKVLGESISRLERMFK